MYLVGRDYSENNGAFIHQTGLDQPVDLLDALHVLTCSHGTDNTRKINHGQVASVRRDELNDDTLRRKVDFVLAQTLHKLVDNRAQMGNIFRCLNLLWFQGCRDGC